MQKKLKPLGKSISPRVEVQSISPHGVWIFVEQHEFFMPFPDFPWFLNATIAQIINVELFHETHLYWPELDIDLDLDSIKHPNAYPLIAVRS